VGENISFRVMLIPLAIAAMSLMTAISN